MKIPHAAQLYGDDRGTFWACKRCFKRWEVGASLPTGCKEEEESLSDKIRTVVHELKTKIFRPSWDKVWMDLARSLAARSTCSRTSVGSVCVSSDNHRVLAVGYNGQWRGGPNRCDSAEVGNCGCLHSEENCILKMDYHDPADKILYVTVSPCLMCAKRIVNARIKEVIYLEEYRKKDGIDLLISAGVIVGRYAGEEGKVEVKKDRP